MTVGYHRSNDQTTVNPEPLIGQSKMRNTGCVAHSKSVYVRLRQSASAALYICNYASPLFAHRQSASRLVLCSLTMLWSLLTNLCQSAALNLCSRLTNESSLTTHHHLLLASGLLSSVVSYVLLKFPILIVPKMIVWEMLPYSFFVKMSTMIMNNIIFKA